MFHSSLCASFFIINTAKSCHCRCSLFIYMSRCKRIRNLQFLCDQFTKYRYTVSQKCNHLSSLIQFFQQFLYRCCPLFFQSHKLMLFKSVNSCIYLLSSGIHDRTDQSLCIIKIICQCIYCRYCYQWFLQGKSQAFGCCRADTESCKGSRSRCHCNSIYGFQFQFRHLHNLI